MKIFKIIFTIICCVFLHFSVVSQITINEGIEAIYSIEDSAMIYVDSSNRHTINDIQKPNFPFEKFSKQHRILKPNNSYWLRIKLTNNTSKTINWVLNFYDPDFKLIEFYDTENIYTSGVEFPFTSKRFFHKNFVFPVQIKPSEEKYYWIKMQSESGSTIKAHLTTIEAHNAYALSEYYLLGLYYGILFILSVYNLILFFHTRYNTYLFYVIYLWCAMLFSFNEDGLGFQFIWGAFPSINLVLRIIGPILFQLSFVIFAISFLELKNNKRNTIYLFITSLISILLSIIQFLGLISTSFSFLFYLCPFMLLLYFTYKKVQARHSDSVYFLIGNSLVLASLLIYYLRLNNWIYSGIFEVYAFNFSVVIEGVVLSMAVGNKIRNGIKEKQTTQEELITALEEKEQLASKVNRELSDKVKERTEQLVAQKNVLELKNTELLTLKDKLYKMNEALDLANFRLKKEVQSFAREKILNKEISYTAFIEIYRDQITCLNYLKALKMEQNTACGKCGATSFKEKEAFVKQCLECKKMETPTSNTIFHSLKFPLPKAFYLVYLTNYNKSKYTLDELSELLNLGRNTCWSFTSKVEKKKEELTKGNKKILISFEDLILF